ncbi:MAG: hypothetical protein Q6353_007545, partial [Candidatus Sigynarchaeum springense]
MSKRTSIITGAMVTLVLAAICMSAVSAIAPAQVAYSDSELWGVGRVLNYRLLFNNTYKPKNDKGEVIAYFAPTVMVSANLKYNITGVSGNAVNITETISGLTVNYPFAINDSHRPFIAVYDQSVSKLDFLKDFAYEIHGGPNMNNTFLVANHGVQNITINATGSSGPLQNFVNHVTYYKNNNSVVPQPGYPQIRNRFIVSSN